MKKKKKRVIVILVIAVILIAVVVSVVRCSSNVAGAIDQMANSVQALPLEQQDLSSSINASGTVESQNVYSVTTDLTCKVKELKVALGDHVEAGDVLCVFDDSDVREQIATLEEQVSAAEKLSAKQKQISERSLQDAKDDQTAQIASANASITDAQTAYDKAVSDYNSTKNQLDAATQNGDDAQAAMLKEQLSSCDASVQQANASLKAAKENLSQVERTTNQAIQSAQDTVDTNALSNSGNSDTAKELAKLYRQLDQMTVTAPQAGIITQLNVAQGSIPNGPLMKIEDNANLKVKVSIKEKDIVKLSEGMAAKITSDALPDQTSAGVVNKVINFASSQSQAADSSSSQGGTSGSAYSAEVNVDAGSSLLLGMSVKVEITLKESGMALAVPYDSIETEEDGSSYVYKGTEKEDGLYQIKKVAVTVGESSDYYTGISSDELSEGDLIISSPDEVSDGAEIPLYIPEDGTASYVTETE